MYEFHLLRSWMQPIQFFIFNFFMSFLMSSSYLLFGLPCGPTDISCDLYTFFLPFSLPAFDVNGQTSLIVVLLCDLLYSYVLLIHLIHRLFWFSMHHLFFCRNKNLSLQLSFQMPGGFQRTDNITVLPTAGQKFPRCFKGLLGGVFFALFNHSGFLFHGLSWKV